MNKRLTISLILLAVVSGGVLWTLLHRNRSPEHHLQQADRHFAADEFDAARIEYLNVLRADRDNLHALRQVAHTWHRQGATLEALRFLRAVIERAPEDIEARLLLARAWMSLAQIGETRKEALAILDQQPDHGPALVLLAKASISEQQIADTTDRLQHFDPETSAPFHLATAILARTRGDLDACAASLTAAEQIDPQSPELHFAWAQLHRRRQDEEPMRQSLKTASELSPPRSRIALGYAKYLVTAGESENAMTILDQLRSAAPDYFPTLITLAELHRLDRNHAEALVLVERVLGSNPGDPGASNTKAMILLDQDKPDQAITTLEQLDSRIGMPRTKVQLAKLHLARNDVAKARTKLNEALSLNPDDADAIVTLANIEMHTQAVDQAANRLEALRKKRPDLPQVEIALADVYQRLERWKDVAEIFRARVRKHPDNAGEHLVLGRTLARMHDPAGARECMRKAHRLQPGNLTILADLVGVEISLKEFASAHALVQARLAVEETAAAHFLAAKIHAAESKWTASRECLSKALDLQPDSLQAYSLLVATYLAEQRPGDAIAELQTLLEKNPDSIRHHMLLALLRERNGDREQAIAAYDTLLTRHPEFPPALNNLAYLCARDPAQLPRAEDLARKARQLAGADPAINDTLGWILFKRGKFTEALPYLEQAAGKMNDNHEIRFHLGMTRAKLGQTAEARRALEFAITAPPGTAWLATAQRELDVLMNPDQQRDTRTIAELETHLRDQPNDAASQLQLGRLHESAGNPRKAAEAFQQATRTNPRLTDAWLGLARLYAGPLDDLDQAIEAGRKARRIDSASPEVAAAVGSLALRRSAKGDVPWAYGMLWEAAQRLDSPSIVLDYARAAYLQGRTGEARKVMQNLVANHPESTEATPARHFLALTLMPDEGWLALADQAEARLAQDPRDVPALMVRARLHPEQEVRIYENLLKRFPDFPLPKIRLASLLIRTPDHIGKADTLAREALAVLPDDPDANRVRGAIAFRKGNHRLAITLLEKDQDRHPLQTEHLFYLGMACLEDGRDSQGSQALRDALKSGLPAPLEQEARDKLGLGSGG